MIGLLLSVLIAVPPAPADPTEQIQRLRQRSNAAIAAHDFAAMKPLLADDYVLLPGSSGVAVTGQAMAMRLQAAFDDPTFVTYVRTPTQITVAGSGKRAAELGRWVGTWRKPDGEMRLTGVYQATWVPGGGEWRLRNESFVTLNCVGSVACPSVD